MTEDPKMAHAEDFYITEDYRAAKELYKSLLVDSPSPFIFQRLAQCHYALKEYDDAMVACEKAIELAPDSASAQVVLSKIYYQQGNMEQAEKQARKAILLDDTIAGSFVVLAGTEMAKKNFHSAVEYAQKAVQLEPDAWDTHLFLGVALGSGIDHKKAIDELKTAYKLNPTKQLRFAVQYQYISANRTLISILLVALMLSALVLGNLTITVIVSVVYFGFGALNFIWRERTAAILSICIGFGILGLYFLFW